MWFKVNIRYNLLLIRKNNWFLWISPELNYRTLERTIHQSIVHDPIRPGVVICVRIKQLERTRRTGWRWRNLKLRELWVHDIWRRGRVGVRHFTHQVSECCPLARLGVPGDFVENVVQGARATGTMIHSASGWPFNVTYSHAPSCVYSCRFGFGWGNGGICWKGDFFRGISNGFSCHAVQRFVRYPYFRCDTSVVNDLAVWSGC